MNRLRWVDRETGRTEDVTLYYDGTETMKHVHGSLDVLSRILPNRPARYELRP